MTTLSFTNQKSGQKLLLNFWHTLTFAAFFVLKCRVTQKAAEKKEKRAVPEI